MLAFMVLHISLQGLLFIAYARFEGTLSGAAVVLDCISTHFSQASLHFEIAMFFRRQIMHSRIFKLSLGGVEDDVGSIVEISLDFGVDGMEARDQATLWGGCLDDLPRS